MLCLVMFDQVLVDLPKEAIEKGVDNYDNAEATAFIDTIQSFFGCCGKTSSADYTLKLKPIPESCKMENYLKGCSKVVTDKLSEYVIVVAGVALGAGAIMVSC